VVFIAPALAVVGVLPGAMYNGAALYHDRESGLLEQLLATPTTRAAIIAAPALAAVAGAIVTTLAVLGLATIGGLNLYGATEVFAIVPVGAVVGLLYGALGMSCAILVKRYAVLVWSFGALLIGSFVLSDIILPASMLPGWLLDVGNINPATYASHAARLVMVAHPSWIAYERNLGVLACLAALSLIVALASFRRYGDFQW
jgi:ABC-2 type transport system permease protein